MKRAYVLCCTLFILVHTNMISQKGNYHLSPFSLITSDQTFFRLGDQVVTIKKIKSLLEKPFVLLSLHHNETVSHEMAAAYLQNHGGTFMYLENKGQHTIDFEFLSKRYSVDPNNIFTKRGRMRSVKSGPYKSVLDGEMEKLANYFIDEWPADKVLVTLHSDEHYPGIDVLQKKKPRHLKAVYYNPEHSSHDYFVTSDAYLFSALKAKGFNVALQDIYSLKDDGSPGIFCARQKLRHLNLITSRHSAQGKTNMLEAVDEILK